MRVSTNLHTSEGAHACHNDMQGEPGQESN
jgi:hypothetical protein